MRTLARIGARSADALQTRIEAVDAWVHTFAVPLLGSLLITTGVALWLFS